VRILRVLGEGLAEALDTRTRTDPMQLRLTNVR
jgi:hypothetical protein